MEGTPRRVGGYLPIRFCVPFQLVRFYYAQRRAGRPRSSPLDASRQLSAVADVGRFGFADAFTAPAVGER
ncbi:MAG: hypothetical protein LBQ66_03370 [Planctomycetaceae bacterium]|nr:hypothetical protein [Planctomycetaceae bacterium]